MALRDRGMAHIVCWARLSGEPNSTMEDGLAFAAAASAFSRAFFAALLATAGVRVPEAYAVAVRAAEAYTALGVGGEFAPAMLSETKAELTDHTDIQPPSDCPLDLSNGLEAALPGWKQVRMVAHTAQVSTYKQQHMLGCCTST